MVSQEKQRWPTAVFLFIRLERVLCADFSAVTFEINLMYTRKKYLAGFCRVLDIKELALCLIKSKFSSLPALREITGLPGSAAGGQGDSSWSIMALWNSPAALLVIIREILKDKGRL